MRKLPAVPKDGLLGGCAACACAALIIGAASAVSAAQREPSGEWTSIHGNVANQRYATMDQINVKNVGRLGAAWISQPFADGATSRMTPVVHDGLMFLAAGLRIYALDASTGKQVWVHQTTAASRSWGLSLGDGMVFTGLVNGHLIALREKDGEVLWDKPINDYPLNISKAIVCPPLFIDGVLYFGLGTELSRGEVVAVDAKSGRVLWRVSTIPGPGQPGHETWPKDSSIWRSGGGGVWVAGAADPELGLVYFVTGNPGPGNGGKVRPGDNLYSVSLIALEMKSGKLRWHQQLVHHDLWEADLSVSPVLFDTEVAGRARRAVAVMRADGYLFLFDRASGEPLIPIDERPVPQNPDVFTAATQPFPRGADSILAACESWKNRVPAGFALGCIFDPPRRDLRNLLVQYGDVRIAPMSYDPQTGYVYAQGTNALDWLSSGGDPNSMDTRTLGSRVPNYPRPTVVVAAIDGHTGKVIWKKDLPCFDDTGYKSDGGALSTAGGLVFHQGGDGTLQAYDAKTGETLWRFQTDFAVGDAPPMSYAIGGTQHVAFIAGTKVWAFSLYGRLSEAAAIPPPRQEEVNGPIEDTDQIETFSIEPIAGNGRRYRLDEYAFNPYRARIRAGSSITFINNGQLPHTIVAQDGSWSTRTLGPTEIDTVTFDEPGAYLYRAKEYPWSYGQIIVVPAQKPSTANGSRQDQAVMGQVKLGKSVYSGSCAVCHGDNLGGRDPTPALTGSGFLARWGGRRALDLFERSRTTMPLTAPGSLSDEDYAAIVAYILDANENTPSTVLNDQTMRGVAVTRRNDRRPGPK